MNYLPSDAEQHWLLVSLAALIRARGYEHFLTHPIVEPAREFFPDRWSYSPMGLDRVTRRLLQYAALGDLDVAIQPVAMENPSHCSIAAFFVGIENGRCLFGYNVDAPPDAEYMAGVMSHEVAHAYRARHGLVVGDRQEEELLTDVTACYLGFGLLTANNSDRYRSSGDLVGGVAYQTWSTRSAGYLTPQGHCFLLGLQLVVRGANPSLRRTVLRHLEPNQAVFTRAAIDACQRRSGDFPQILRIPPLDQCPDAIPLRELLRPLPKFEGEEVTSRPEPELPVNAGRSVFRWRRKRTVSGAIVGFVTGMFIGLLAGKNLSNPVFALMLPVVGLIVGSCVGRLSMFDVCAGTECGTRLKRDVTICPKCGGRIMGSIPHLIDRFDAEEEVLRRELGQGRSPETR